MKKIAIIFMFLLLALPQYARTFVLITGVSNYGDERINLYQATKDAKAFKEVMETQTKDITLLTSKYANRDNVLEKLRAICNRATKDDRVIFYFSGHGMPGGICAFDNTILYTEITSIFEKSEASMKVCFIDACYSGSIHQATNEYSSLQHAIKGSKDQVFFVGCKAEEYSIESSWVGAGYFTQALIKGLRGKSDADGDRKITIIELFKYVWTDVVKRSRSEQHPQLIAPANLHNSVIAEWK